MNLTFQFSPEDLCAAYEATRYSGDNFTLVFQYQRKKTININLINIYLISNKVQKIIKSDPLNTSLIIKNDIYSEIFLDNFFKRCEI